MGQPSSDKVRGNEQMMSLLLPLICPHSPFTILTLYQDKSSILLILTFIFVSHFLILTLFHSLHPLFSISLSLFRLHSLLSLYLSHPSSFSTLLFLTQLKSSPLSPRCKSIDEKKNYLIKTSHPSPLGAYKTASPFMGSKCFSRTNDILIKTGQTPIDWNIL